MIEWSQTLIKIKSEVNKTKYEKSNLIISEVLNTSKKNYAMKLCIHTCWKNNTQNVQT